MPRVVVVGLGPAGPELCTSAVLEAIASVPTRFLRTTRHPAAPVVGEARSFDEVYDAASSFDDVYATIVEELVAAAEVHGEVLYAVPGSPSVAERTVELLTADMRVDVVVHGALSFLDLAWTALGVDPLAAGVRLVDGRRFAVEAAGERGPLLVAQCDSVRVLSDIKLAVTDAPTAPVVVLQRLGLPDAVVQSVAWDDLDRDVEPDHLTSVYIPELASPVAGELARFAELVRTLRERCPWDQEQTHQTLTRHLLEETYEVLEAIEGLERHGSAPLEEELGDLLFQVVFHATLGAEAGEFDLADVARGIHDKLVHRHPHVFGSVDAATADAVVSNWEQIKRDEKGRDSLMDGIPAALPSLLHAHKVQRKAASVGFDWPDVAGPWSKVDEELAEARAEPSADEIGDLLFSVVNVARHLGVDAEAALRGATGKFRDRFKVVENLASARGLDLRALDLAGLDALWDEAKAVPPRTGEVTSST
ncbi:MAG TPA: nucleoside triphosphate pyrophosphohydrolase [Acidimicrobiales bacterium]|nr:nucleoside triphosphate pyrophosphohydrolase [Acidimicrobiales bacterium]